MPITPFHPWARNAHFQTIISSLYKPQPIYHLSQHSYEYLLKVQGGVYLQGFLTPQQTRPTKGLVLLIHGWLGCATSNYVLVVGQHLYDLGYAIFRLNLRDHGDTLALNREPFRSDMLDEVFAATSHVAQIYPQLPFYMVGASLGGNFVTRLACQAITQPIANLRHTIAINPAVNPAQATVAIDTSLGGFYRHYFRRKWIAYYQQKQALFPEYDFKAVIAEPTCWGMTEKFIRGYSPYPDALTYFQSYTITPNMLQNLNAPLTMVTSVDDPIIPVADFEPFSKLNSPYFEYHVLPHGGHVGFIDLFPLRHRIAELVQIIIES